MVANRCIPMGRGGDGEVGPPEWGDPFWVLASEANLSRSTVGIKEMFGLFVGLQCSWVVFFFFFLGRKCLWVVKRLIIEHLGALNQ